MPLFANKNLAWLPSPPLTYCSGRNCSRKRGNLGWKKIWDGNYCLGESKTRFTNHHSQLLSSSGLLLFRCLTDLVLAHHSDCFRYQWLNESNRNKEYAVRELFCDKGLSGWNRFGGGAGIKMPTSCVRAYRCGTAISGWMNGAHPTVSDGKVTRRVCYCYDGNCCYMLDNIEVVNCGKYYVYKLSEPPSCSLRYCGSDN